MATDASTDRAGWRGTIALAALVDLAVMVPLGVSRADRETLVFSGLLVVAVVLLRVGKGLLGRLACLLVFADIASWMLPGAVANIAHREELIDVAIPSTLAAMSIAGALAALGLLIRRGRPHAGGRTASVVGWLAVVVCLVAAGVGYSRGRNRDRGPRSGEFEVVIQDLKYSSEDLNVQRPKVSLYVSNRDLFWHTFTIDALGVNVRLPVGADRRFTFSAEPGKTYRFYCAIPGHEKVGMEGTLTVA